MSAAPVRSGRPWLVPSLLLFVLWGLGLHGLVTGDPRAAWGMFPYELRYNLEYRCRYGDGHEEIFDPSAELKGAERKLRPWPAGGEHKTYYGLPQVRAWIRSYLRYSLESQGAVGVREVSARFSYRIGRGVRFDESLVER